MSDAGPPTPDFSPPPGRLPRRARMLTQLCLACAAGGLWWWLHVERDPRLFGDWYGPGGQMFRFEPDGTFRTYLPGNTGLELWAVREWSTTGDVIHVRRPLRTRMRSQWDRLVRTVQRSNVQVIQLNLNPYRVIDWGESTITLQRMVQPPHRDAPPVVFTRTPPVARTAPAVPEATPQAR